MNIKILSTLRKFNKLIIAFVVIISFFSSYNIFLVDATLEDLRFSLSQTAFAFDIRDASGLDIALNRSLIQEISPTKLSSPNLMTLEFVSNIMSKGKSFKQLADAESSLRNVIKDKEEQRGILLTALDKINAVIKSGIKYLTHLPQYLKARKVEPITKDGLELFNKSVELEKANKLQEAIAGYSEFVNKYPDYEKIALVKLRLAYCLQRTGEFNKASVLYKDIIKNYPAEKESDIAQGLLSQLGQRDKLVARKNTVMAKAAEISPADKEALQKSYYELGVINTQLLDYNEARQSFKRASEVIPGSELGVKSLFNAAWLNKQLGNLKESLSQFEELSRIKEPDVLALDSAYQIADIYHKEGLYQESINKYLEVADTSKNENISALLLFQSGASYMYDLNDEQKAKEIFAMLTKKFPKSIYAKYLMPTNPVGIFLTYLVPRGTRTVAWRAVGLVCLSGYSGQIAKLSLKMDEKVATRSINKWFKSEFPDTIGNLYVDILGTEIKFDDNKVSGSGNITMGKFDVRGEAEGKVTVAQDGQADAVITRARLARVPIHPMLLNNALSGVSLIAKKNLPIMVKDVSIKKEEFSAEAYGGRRILERIRNFWRNFSGVEVEVTDLKDTVQEKGLYKLFEERFPDSDFSPMPTYSEQEMFLDFFTRMSLYSGFKVIESVKDTKLDFERSIRTLGLLAIKKVNFGIDHTAEAINTALNRYITREFPMLINGEFFFDVKALELSFTDAGEIKFRGLLNLSYLGKPSLASLDIKGTAMLVIDQESKLPLMQFKEVALNGVNFPVERMNLVSKRCLNLLKDSNVPFELKEIKINGAGITLRGRGARDFVSRIFADPDIFTFLLIRDYDLHMAGIEKLKERPKDITDFWRGRMERELWGKEDK